MKRIFIYAVLMIGALLVPTERSDLGKLKPVETVFLYTENGQVVLETDTGDLGRGTSVATALENMKDTTSGIIYLDTADYLLVGEGAEPWIMQLRGLVKNSVRVCYVQSAVDVTQAASYLTVHKPNLTLKEWRPGAPLKTLCARGEQLILK